MGCCKNPLLFLQTITSCAVLPCHRCWKFNITYHQVTWVDHITRVYFLTHLFHRLFQNSLANTNNGSRHRLPQCRCLRSHRGWGSRHLQYKVQREAAGVPKSEGYSTLSLSYLWELFISVFYEELYLFSIQSNVRYVFASCHLQVWIHQMCFKHDRNNLGKYLFCKCGVEHIM